MKTVAFSFLGVSLDAGKATRRWEKWRPTIGLCSQDDLEIDRLELLYDPKHAGLARFIARDLAAVSPRTEVVFRALPLDDPWNFELVYQALLDVAQAYPWAEDDEQYLIHITTGTHVAQICLFLLTEARRLPGRLIQTSPARGRGASPSGTHSIIDLDLSRYDAIAQRFALEKAEATSFLKDGIDTRSPAFNRLIDEIELVALRSTMPLLLMGPTGAGKTRLARRIYDLRKARRKLSGRFVEVNCATLRGDQAMGALFGHIRGAFTGAVKDRPGLLRAAQGGMLFLDEIGELGLDEQAMLLRALEGGRFLPVGADQEVESQFQLLAGTNRDLRAAVADGTFRADLLARIDTWTWTLPALKERPEDIAPNLDYELAKVSRQAGRRVTFNREALARFLAFATSPQATWVRNFRDLGAAVQRMVTLAPGDRIDEATVDNEIARLTEAWAGLSTPVSDVSDDVVIDSSSAAAHAPVDTAMLQQLLGDQADELDLFDAVQLTAVVRVCRQSRSMADAGRTLFAASRRRRTSTNDSDRVRKYLARHGLSWADVSRP